MPAQHLGWSLASFCRETDENGAVRLTVAWADWRLSPLEWLKARANCARQDGMFANRHVGKVWRNEGFKTGDYAAAGRGGWRLARQSWAMRRRLLASTAAPTNSSNR
jgi:hypothetical protein